MEFLTCEMLFFIAKDSLNIIFQKFNQPKENFQY